MNKKKAIKVYLQSPWKFPDSPYYKSLIENPPEGVEFLNAEKQKGVITNKNKFLFSNKLKKFIRGTLKKLNLSIPNAHKSPEGNYDLIHCAHCLSRNKNKPWIADIESIFSFTIPWKNSKSTIKRIKKILQNKNCKKVLPWTTEISNEILRNFPEVKPKIEVVYPAIPEIKNLKKPKNKKLKIIFIARYFDIKGGLIALEILEKLRKKYEIEGIAVSPVPENWKRKYSKLKIYNLMPQKELFKLMQSSDLFLYPGSIDTFGFSLLEAMAFGLPIITINTKWTKSRKEIIENNKTGFIFDVKEKLSFNEIKEKEKKVVEKLIEKVSELIENKKLRERMSKNCMEIIKNGKFSIKERNKKLKRIYEDALR